MKTFRFDCANCKSELYLALRQASSQVSCHTCGSDVTVDVFPALINPPAAGNAGEVLMMDEESSCFYHPSKKAVIPCEGCGRFLCGLCDVEYNTMHLCPSCIESGVEKGQLEGSKTEYTHYDEIALALAVAPIIVWPVTIITAPIANYYGIRHWNTPLSETPRGRWRFVVAILFAGLLLIGWTMWIGSLFF